MRASLMILTFLIAIVSVVADTNADDERSSKCVPLSTISASIRLDAGCRYSGPLVINSSKVVLDCSGATIDASGANAGISIYGTALEDITVENCIVVGAKNQGIYVRPPSDAGALAGLPLPLRYELAPKRISILNSTVVGSGNVGIYVGNYAQKTVIRGSTVSRSGGTAVYLDASSIEATLEKNAFIGNGFGGQPIGSQKRNREAVAIDSSSFNTILDNRFENNSAGGVFLYKNCWEHHTNPRQAQRWMHASFNTISNNQFKEKIGVWIASRQTKMQDGMDCGDTPVAKGYFRDYAEHNTITSNVFRGGDAGINVQDDQTTILANSFEGQKDACVVLGSELRDTLLGAPIQGTLLKHNQCTSDGAGYLTKGNSSFSNCFENALNNEQFRCPR
jgi:parallel beta-helix repeat protein